MKKNRPYWWWTFIGWLLATVVLGIVGALTSRYLGAPEYFGGTIGFVLTGMAGLFALAARMTRKS